MNALFSRFNLLTVFYPPALRSVRAIITCLVVVGFLALLPGNAMAQIYTVGADNKPTSEPSASPSPNIGGLEYVAVFSYIDDSESTKGTVTSITAKKLGDYFIPTVSTGAKAGLEAGVKAGADKKNGPNAGVSATTGASVSVTATWDFKPPRPTTSTYDLLAEKYLTASYENRGTIKVAEVMGFGQVGTGLGSTKYGILNNYTGYRPDPPVGQPAWIRGIDELVVYEYGRVNNHLGGWIGEVFLQFSDRVTQESNGSFVIKDADGKIQQQNIGNEARLINNGFIDMATIKQGGYLDNSGVNNTSSLAAYIEQVNVAGGSLVNQHGAEIGAAIISGGTIANQNGATINAIAATGGTINNLAGGTIGNVFVESGTVYFGRGGDGSTDANGTDVFATGTFGAVEVRSAGTLINGIGGIDRGSGFGSWGNGLGIIDTVNVLGGTLRNGDGSNAGHGLGEITTAHVGGRFDAETGQFVDTTIGGILYNGYGSRLQSLGLITTAYVHSGTLNNGWNGSDWSWIGSLNLLGGTVNNASRIDSLRYTDGTYNHQQGGSIGTLTVAGRLTGGSNWGNVEDLVLDANPGGINTIFVGNNIIVDGITLNVLRNSWNYGTVGTANVIGGYVSNQGDNARIETANVSSGQLGNHDNARIEIANVSGGSLDNGWRYRDWDTAHIADTAAHIETANISGGVLINRGTARIETANVSNGMLYNRDNAHIDTANVSIGELYNVDNTRIDTANVTSGLLENRNNAHIEMAIVSGGRLNNRDTARIDTANVNGGEFYNVDNTRLDTANVWGNGLLINRGNAHITTADVSGGLLENRSNARIETVNVSDGLLTNSDTARIDTANVWGNGLLINGGNAHITTVDASGGVSENRSNARIETVNVSDGLLTNRDTAHIDTANVTSGLLENRNNAQLEMVNISGGRLTNWGAARIITANVDGGELENWSSVGIDTANVSGGTLNNILGRIETANVNSGTLNNTARIETAWLQYGNGILVNRDGGTIGSLFLDDGIVINSSTINNLIYSGGIYNGTVNSRIDTLTVVGRLPGTMYWGDGIVNNLVLDAASGLINSVSIGPRVTVDGVTFNSIDEMMWYDPPQTSNSGFVGTANVNSGGTFANLSGVTINTLSFSGGTVNNGGHIDNLTFTSGTYNRAHGGSTGTIGTLNVGVNASGTNWGNVSTANVNSGGRVTNTSGNRITSAFVNSGGNLSNLVGGMIIDATLNGGTISNAGTITGLTYTGGNYSGTGNIGTLTVAGDSSSVDWGSLTNLNNQASGIVRDFTLASGSTINNGGLINNLTYTGDGIYNKTHNGSTGTIGTLTVTGDSTDIDWGNVLTAKVNNGGAITNHSGNRITSAFVNNGGNLSNLAGGTITGAMLDGGMVSNAGRIDYLDYYSGIYTQNGNGTIGMLALRGELTGNNWGTVEHLGNYADMEYLSIGNASTVPIDIIYGFSNFANIGTANVSSGWAENFHWWHFNETDWTWETVGGNINTANINGDGWMWNGGNISTANINGDGWLSNDGEGYIDTANVSGNGMLETASWTHYEHYNEDGGYYDYSTKPGISTANVSDNGWMRNRGHVGTVNVNDNGEAVNGGIIDTANIYAGSIKNNGATFEDGLGGYGAFIGDLTMDGGLVSNGGRIGNLTYIGGKYQGEQIFEDWWDPYNNIHTGSIGTLNLAGNATGIDWGRVDDLVFDSNGSGILHLTAFAVPEANSNVNGSGIMGFQAASSDLYKVEFSGITLANSANLTGGNLSLDLSYLATGDAFFNRFDKGFDIATLLGINDDAVHGTFNAMHVYFGDAFSWEHELLTFLNTSTDGGWQYTYNRMGFVLGNFPDIAPVPEPATLAMIGLGLAGLGWARRRQMLKATAA